MNYASASSSGSGPCEVLRRTERYGGAQTTIDRIDPATGLGMPFYILNQNNDKAIAILHANPQAQMPDHALATIKLHSLSSKIDVVFRGMPFKMKSNTLGSEYRFDMMGQSYSWSCSSIMSASTLLYKDGEGNTLAKWMKRPDGRLSSSGAGPTFVVFVPPQRVDMDLLIVTGLAVIAYWDKEKKEAAQVAEDVLTL
ncbi:hypothetical protein C8034_v000649 [Colletotrichum sidae]|uniref:Uncharacterized protein n=1 Tax=Colletotrichum sidae TaxID=1347389 RepID=A0A4R8TFW1_9PEZI|nr:hypothetical protein C8034_v000649 [Colletotrichum sidae]